MEYLDLTKFKTKAAAAKAAYEHLRKLCAAEGENPDIEVAIYSPEESRKRGYTSGWQVTWECGPHMWGLGWTLAGMARAEDWSWFCETHWGFDLCFVE
jgi:hypothetical protein